jgi:hypothetical protein
MKGPAVSNVLRGFERRIESENKLNKEVERMREKILNEEWRFDPKIFRCSGAKFPLELFQTPCL